MKKKAAQKPLILSAYARGEHLDVFTVMEERKEVRTQIWERMAPPLTSTRKAMSGSIGTDTGKFQTTILCVDSSHCFLQTLYFPTTDLKEVHSMAATSVSLFPVLNQPEYVHSYSVLAKDTHGTSILSLTMRRDELIPLLEKVEQWGIDLPLLVPDAWAVWKHSTLDLNLPQEYAWVWMDPASDERILALKIFIVRAGQLQFVFQPFAPADGIEAISEAITMALAVAGREQRGVAADAPFYFSSYRLDLSRTMPQLEIGRHPRAPLALHHPPQECAALLRQRDGAGFKNWLPDFWKTYQFKRALARKRAGFLKAAGILYAVLIAGFLAFTFWQKDAMDREQRAIEFQRDSFEKAVALKKQVTRMKTQAEGNQNALDVLFLTTEALPKEVTLTGYGFKFQDGLSLRGFAANNASVYDFVEALKRQKPFRSVELNSVRNNPQKNWVEFDIQCKLGMKAEADGKVALK